MAKGEKIVTGLIDELVIVDHVGCTLLCLVRNVYLLEGQPMYTVQVMQPCTFLGARIYTAVNPYSSMLLEKRNVKVTGGSATATEAEIEAYHSMMAKNDPAWPTHPDGQPKKMGEMTKEEQSAQVKAAGKRLEKEFAQMNVNVEFGGEKK